MQRSSSVGKTPFSRLPVSNFKGLLVVSGVLNIIDNLDYMDTRGLYKKIMTRALEADVEGSAYYIIIMMQTVYYSLVATRGKVIFYLGEKCTQGLLWLTVAPIIAPIKTSANNFKLGSVTTSWQQLCTLSKINERIQYMF